MAENTTGSFIYFALPDNPALLAAVGRVALRHAQLDDSLKMTVKTITDMNPVEARKALANESSSRLRDLVRKLARNALGDCRPLLELRALLADCKAATTKRNDLMHTIWARELDGEHGTYQADGSMKPLPSVEDLDRLDAEIKGLVGRLTNVRIEGFLRIALNERRGTDLRAAPPI